ncbi:uncharacterized protein K452DRAFT_149731 [Aplosporella prunicola CBS 121167]|uniref:Uncharacterized protein n=1 Tax=Aplosporella prunicola CBS 121167 TaxID=1176127 RepID=A0A6A6AYB5_9PEZI|nr:uncharacterized protein K452DRAFT_149731 [Aplosporella prunicola CBS 121167]KAF2135974.1 hypothetical protein K452DRAFT_149731 [Aplosporella prunicola CBS 121167]
MAGWLGRLHCGGTAFLPLLFVLCCVVLCVGLCCLYSLSFSQSFSLSLSLSHSLCVFCARKKFIY